MANERSNFIFNEILLLPIIIINIIKGKIVFQCLASFHSFLSVSRGIRKVFDSDLSGVNWLKMSIFSSTIEQRGGTFALTHVKHSCLTQSITFDLLFTQNVIYAPTPKFSRWCGHNIEKPFIKFYHTCQYVSFLMFIKGPNINKEELCNNVNVVS